MTKIKVASLWLLVLAGTAAAQQPPAPMPGASAQPGGGAAKADPTKADAGKNDPGKAGTSDFATQETYKMKDGGMYQPPAQRPASPAQDFSIYGRT